MRKIAAAILLASRISSPRRCSTPYLDCFDGQDTVVTRDLRRSLLAVAFGSPGSLDLVGAAERALACARRDEARMLFEVAFIRAGFCSRGMAAQADLARRTGLWSTPFPLSDRAGAEPLSLIERASLDLRKLRALTPSASHHPDDAPQPPIARLQIETGAVARLIHDIFVHLQHEPCDETRLTASLDEAVAARHAAVAPTVETSTGDLAASAALANLQMFLRDQADLAFAPFGSAELLHATSRLEHGALGPYLNGVADLLRGGPDLVELVILSDQPERPAWPAEGEHWAAMLMRRLPRSMLREVIDWLGDLGLSGIVKCFLVNGASDLPEDLLWVARDVGLDAGDFDLAIDAQRLVVALRPDRAIEWIVLGEILATGGKLAEAETALTQGLSIEPIIDGGIERLDAVRRRDFRAFEIHGGFGSSNDRKRRRFDQRASQSNVNPSP